MDEKDPGTIIPPSPSALRGLMFQGIVGVFEGRVSVPMANAAASLSAEIHKSIKQEWDMRDYAMSLGLKEGRVLLGVLGDESAD